MISVATRILADGLGVIEYKPHGECKPHGKPARSWWQRLFGVGK